MTTENEIAKKIIATGYFANQIPCEFRSIALSEIINKLDLTKSRLSNNGFNKWCNLIRFSIPKTENFRRILSVPHPLHYILLAQLIEKNWGGLKTHFSKSEFSLTTPKITEDSVVSKYKMSEKINRRIKNLVFNRYILQADITRYYPSIYTHSISWALHTKKVAKLNQRDNSYFGNEIDRLVRNMQDGQTLGIPVGPVTSLIIQEIIGTAIDDEFKREYGNKLVGSRYTDDMEYYFSTSEEAEKAQAILNKILIKYELDLNISKTRIISIPQVLGPEWVYYFKKYKFRTNKNNKESSITLQNTDIKEFFSMAFKYKALLNEKGILKYAVKKLRKIVILKENWDMFESLLLQSTLVDSSIIPIVFEIIEGHKYKGFPLNYDKIKKFVNILIKDNMDLRNDFEVSWGLSLAAKLDIAIEEETSELLLKSDNAIINILVMILDSKKFLEGTLDFSYYETFFVEESLYDSNWLFYYECCMHGWLNQNKNNQHFKNNKFFVQLLNHDISFVNPNYSKALEAVNESVISLCIKYYENSKEPLEAEEIMVEIIKEYSFSLEDEVIEKLNKKLTSKIDKINKSKTTEETEDKKTKTKKTKVEITSKSNENTWLFNFFTTNINENTKIRGSSRYSEALYD